METAVEEMPKVRNYLENRKIKVMPIKKSDWLPSGHDGEFLFTGCKQSFCLPIDKRNGKLVGILNKEEQIFFEKELYLKEGDLSIYRKGQDNWWHKFNVSLDKSEMILDLSDPLENLQYRVLRVNSPMIVNSWKERNRAGAKYALVDLEEETSDKVKIADKRKRAYKALGKMEDSRKQMYDFLRVYGRIPAKDASADWMIGQLNDIIEDNNTIDNFLTVIDDPNYGTKLLVQDAIKAGALKKIGKTRYALPEGDVIGETLESAIAYLSDNENQDVFLKIKNQIELAE